jgi:hypothetical protein
LDSRNLETVKSLWRVYEEDGQRAAMEALLELCDERSEFRPYTASGRVLRGPDEMRAFFEESAAAGTTVHASAQQFEEDGETVRVAGSIRVTRSGGGLADAQIRWTYVFHEGRVRVAEYEPLGGRV